MFKIIKDCEENELAANILTYYGLRHTAKSINWKIRQGSTAEDAHSSITFTELRRFKKADVLYRLLKILTGV